MKKYLFFLLLAFFGPCNISLASSSLTISEIMYDFPGSDDGHEWIEIANPTDEPVDLTGFKVSDDGATRHAINPPGKNGGIGSMVLPAGGYAVLADDAATFLSDYPGFSGTVLDTVLSLNNAGGAAEILDDSGNEVFSISYTSALGASGDGDSLALQPDGSLLAAAPTPGSAAAFSSSVDANTDDRAADQGSDESNQDQTQDQNQNQTQDQPSGDQNQISPPDIIFSEIMYDLPGSDDGQEWFEIYNAGATETDLADWKFFEDGTNHALTSVGSSVLPAGGFAIIAEDPDKFSAAWPTFSGIIFKSSFSLINTGESLTLKDPDGNIIDQVSYTSDMGASGDGNSLQKNGDTWISAGPTPGIANKTEAEAPPEPPAGGGGGSGGSSSAEDVSAETSAATPAAAPAKSVKISLKIDSPAYSIVNSDFTVSASGVAADSRGDYAWNFGDGEVIEVKDNPEASYNYQFAGQYLVTLDYVPEGATAAEKATVKIKAEDNPIVISAVKEDGSVELDNKATHQEDIAGWIIKEGNVSFTLPAETAILASSKIVIPDRITKFPADFDEIDLFFPAGGQAFAFKKIQPVQAAAAVATATLPAKKIAPKAALVQAAKAPPERPAAGKPEVAVIPAQAVLGTELSAAAGDSMLESKFKIFFPWFVGLSGIIALSSSLYLLIRSKSSGASRPQSGPISDFKIIN